MPAIVTKQSLTAMLNRAAPEKRIQIVGRALIALFDRQTQAEQNANSTDNSNGVGFASCDARSGSLTAKSFLKNKTLSAWQLDRWMAPQKDGFPRICKYAKQLNAIAEVKAAKEHKALESKYGQLCVEYGDVVDSDDPQIIKLVLDAMKVIEVQLGNVPYRIGGAVVN
jgi:hypothetical protein